MRTGSLGVLSAGPHSGLDLVAAIITFLSVRMSDQPADEKHPYGHGKFENFSAFVETGLLGLTALYIIYEAFMRLFFRSVHIQPSILAIVILLCALAIDVTRARKLSQVARKFSSEALEADALHFSTDVWSTVVVIAGVGLVWAGGITAGNRQSHSAHGWRAGRGPRARAPRRQSPLRGRHGERGANRQPGASARTQRRHRTARRR